MDRPEPGSVEDLATLAKLDDNILLDELRVRYNKNLIYVSIPNSCRETIQLVNTCMEEHINMLSQ